MGLTSKPKDPLPYIRDRFALGGTRDVTKGSRNLGNIRDYSVSEIVGEGRLTKSDKAGKILRRGPATQVRQMFLYKLIGTF